MIFPEKSWNSLYFDQSISEKWGCLSNQTHQQGIDRWPTEKLGLFQLYFDHSCRSEKRLWKKHALTVRYRDLSFFLLGFGVTPGKRHKFSPLPNNCWKWGWSGNQIHQQRVKGWRGGRNYFLWKLHLDPNSQLKNSLWKNHALTLRYLYLSFFIRRTRQ